MRFLLSAEPETRLTLASTNDAATLDKAAIRTGRFDSVVEVGDPNGADAARIVAALIRDIREVVRRPRWAADGTGPKFRQGCTADLPVVSGGLPPSFRAKL